MGILRRIVSEGNALIHSVSMVTISLVTVVMRTMAGHGYVSCIYIMCTGMSNSVSAAHRVVSKVHGAMSIAHGIVTRWHWWWWSPPTLMLIG